jgi:fructose transport system substrate-binding protein
MKKLFSRRTLAAVAVLGASSLLLSACSSSDDAGGDAKVGVSLILKNDTNPFFVAMTKGAKAKAAELGVDLSVAAGKDETDDAGQVASI